VVDSLVRIAHMDADDVEGLVSPCVEASSPYGYRNKIELAFQAAGGRARLGMHAASGNGVVKVDTCPLLEPFAKGLPKAVAGSLSYLSNSHRLSFERVGIRASARTRDVEVALWTDTGAFPRAQVAKVLGDATKATSVVRVMTKGPAKARRIAGVERLSGAGSWTERLGDETMRLSAPSFFQVSTRGAEELQRLVLEALDPTEDDVAMDLYCGAGTFTLPLARRCSFVDAVESYGPAVRDLRRNLETSGLDNVDAVGGDAGREFPDDDADVIVVDPPRAGLDQTVIEQLSAQSARAIAYVSCDPATLARDLARFIEAGTFHPTSVTPVDLFPQTFHVETVVLMSRIG
jgi:23S rRNA (uracil1939-C5)-methyltransferase